MRWPSLVFVMAAGCGKPAEPNPTPAAGGAAVAAPEKKVYARDELRKMLVGKKTDEVIGLVGKPDTTSDSGRAQYWYYKELSRDPVTGKLDDKVQVCIERDAVESVNY